MNLSLFYAICHSSQNESVKHYELPHVLPHDFPYDLPHELRPEPRPELRPEPPYVFPPVLS